MATTKITSPDLFDLGSLNTALKLPSGTTAERPTSPSTGEWRYNTTTNLVEFWDGGAWRDLQSEDIPPIPSENFNTVLYTGNGSTQSITGVGFQPDFVWVKVRSTTGSGPLADSTRGTGKAMYSNLTDADYTFPAGQGVTSFDADGFSVGDDATGNGGYNGNGKTYVAWCWKANGGTTSSNTDGTNITSTVQVNAKAGFSIVQFTTPGSFSGSNTVGHGLGSTPDAIFVKRTDGVEDWYVYHQAAGLNKASRLNSTINYANATYLFGTVNSTVFNPNYTSATNLTNIAYCFKSIPGYSKFGSYTGNGTTQVVNTGFQPGWIMIKSTVGNDNWRMYDTTRGITAGGFLKADTNAAEDTADAPNFLILSNGFEITAGGTTVGNNANGNLYTYYAFAADQSAAPVLADSFANKLYTGTGSSQSITGLGFSPNYVWMKQRSFVDNHYNMDSLRGAAFRIHSNLTAAQNGPDTNRFTSFDTDGFTIGSDPSVNQAGSDFVTWNWKANSVPTINTDGTIQSVVSANQAAGFSIVQGTASGGLNTVNSFGHGLGVKPDLIIIKSTSSVDNWYVYNSISGAGKSLYLNDTAAEFSTTNVWANTEPTASVFSIKDGQTVSVGATFITYCFASISGFSKIGSYTGNGSSSGPTVTTGFQPSWIMIKRTDAGGTNWNIMDSTRGNSDYLLAANTDGAEVTTETPLNTTSTGFVITESSAYINASGGTYIYMAFKENPVQYAIPSGEMAFLVAAGGGGGGFNEGAGGGAGGLRTSYGLTSGGGASAESNLTLASGTYTITVGGGGIAGTYTPTWAPGGDGSVSSITGLVSITTVGGGGGGTGVSAQVPDIQPGRDGGSGGGGSRGPNKPGGIGTANQGFAGGASNVSNGDSAGGGGGATQAGQVPPGAGGADGGNGLTSAITGSNSGYAGGGGGGSYTGGGPVGLGKHGGGAGVTTGTPNAGVVNTGGGAGGGGGSGLDSARIGGVGGSGVVILRMNTSDYSGVTSGSPTISAIGSETILQYLASGSYVHNPSTAAGQMNYMVLAGGASGASNGGGGGAGGLRSSWFASGGGAAGETPITLSSGTYTITIGGGGASIDNSTSYQSIGNSGTATTISGNATVNTVGGGGGGSNNNPPATGGCGGGSGSGSGGSTGAAGTAGEGFAGGNGMASTHPYTGAGGGGTAAVGATASGSAPGDGGAGASITITGAGVNYGGGGGGTGGTGVGYTGPGGAGGTGGGGAGGAYNGSGTAGSANTGGGGGATGDAGSFTSGAGGSGVVILRLITSEYSGTTTGSPTVTTVGTETVLTFTGSGTYVHS